MVYEIQDLNKDEKLEKRIVTTCKFNNVKYTIQQGRILKIVNTNISLIEPHKFSITIKGKDIIVIYFNKENMFLYNRSIPLTVKQLDTLIKDIKSNI
ncbi:MAG: hypothetical protein E7159_04875 [Firmicutes bacterium]|nr:hypothetical protein [Bacillota bacterium]